MTPTPTAAPPPAAPAAPAAPVIRRRTGFLATVMLTLFATQAMLAPAVLAHNILISSTPAAGSVIAHAPASIELVFDQDVKPFYPQIAVTITGHDPIQITPTVTGPTVTADLTIVDLPPDPPDGAPVAWQVGYRVVSADGHPVTGIINFSVGARPAPTTDNGQHLPTTATATVQPDGRSPVWWIIGSVLAAAAVTALIAALTRHHRTDRTNSR